MCECVVQGLSLGDERSFGGLGPSIPSSRLNCQRGQGYEVLLLHCALKKNAFEGSVSANGWEAEIGEA